MVTSQMSGRLLSGYSISVEQDMIDVTEMGPVADPNWTYLDEQGHGHFCGAATDAYRGYPTLTWIEDVQGYRDGDGEEYNAVGHHECRFCGERIVPGTKFPVPSKIPGKRHIMVTTPDAKTFEITERTFDEINDECRRVIARILHAKGVWSS